VDRAGHQQVTELLEVRAGEQIRRDYHLARPTASGPRDTAAAGSAPAAPRPRDIAVAGAAPAADGPRQTAASGTGSAAADPGRAAPGRAAGSARAAAPAPSARTLLQRAQQRRLAREWRGAIRTYRELIRRHPGSSSARVAQVSIGTLQLDHLGRPAAALRSFGRYLRRHRRGTLAQEAAFGRLRALRALGRTCAELRGLRAFLKRYPRSLHRARAEQRQKALQSGAGASCP
jgi:TolA-binding protein